MSRFEFLLIKVGHKKSHLFRPVRWQTRIQKAAVGGKSALWIGTSNLTKGIGFGINLLFNLQPNLSKNLLVKYKYCSTCGSGTTKASGCNAKVNKGCRKDVPSMPQDCWHFQPRLLSRRPWRTPSPERPAYQSQQIYQWPRPLMTFPNFLTERSYMGVSECD